MYTHLLVKHFENSVPGSIHLPVPGHFRRVLAGILILRNPNYPRHFLNGCYLILDDSVLPTTTEESKNSFSSMEDSILRLALCEEERWHWSEIWGSSKISLHRPLVVSTKYLGWPYEPNITNFPSGISEGPSLVLAIKPSFIQKIRAGVQCYLVQLLSKSSIIDGTDYFCAEYPAKSYLVNHETTLAWLSGGCDRPVGYIQYIAIESEEHGLHVLITGLAVQESHRRRGYARALISAVIHGMWNCAEVWISVREENSAAVSLDKKCGFQERKRQWDISSRTKIPSK
ncbi:hypothetical protein CVT26_009965 [Gymnopilus dilepis]|uniref:N-acetyltransferase domain-containing protein n=1 Tax=Gymnopilus dilepis TaxID=231916 RepID=A0A409VL64_9AGAR|nr:hypothetical protein CVT26_009965 [Gymnopilus dilepis]